MHNQNPCSTIATSTSGRKEKRRRVVRESSFTNFEGRHEFASGVELRAATDVADHDADLRAWNESVVSSRLAATPRQPSDRLTSGDERTGKEDFTVENTVFQTSVPRSSDRQSLTGTDAAAIDDLEDAFENEDGRVEQCSPPPEPHATEDHATFNDESGQYGGTGCGLSVSDRRMLSWTHIMACMFVTGKIRFTAIQYGIIAAALHTANADVRLPTYKTIRSTTWNHMLSTCFPGSEIHAMTNDIPAVHGRRSDVMVRTKNGSRERVQSCVRIVKPSEWAKVDVATANIYTMMFEHPRRANMDHLSIERSLLVQDRSRALNSTPTMWAVQDGCFIPVRIGGHVQLTCETRPRPVQGKCVDSLGWPVATTDTRAVRVTGVVAGTHYVRRVADAQNGQLRTDFASLTSTEQSVLRGFTRSAVTSALCGRRVVYVGDACTVLRRSIMYSEMNDVVCVLISSFLGAASGVPSDRLVWVDGAAANTSRNTIRILSEVVVTRVPELVKGSQRATQLLSNATNTYPNIGFLDDGTRFVVYRIALYADGFQQLKSMSDTRSVGGFYMLPLGLPHECRRTSAAARVLSLTPAGQSLNEVMNMVVDDLVHAATRGVDGVDPYGRIVKIFVDPVAFLGDYPAVSEATDVMGHTANAFCTLCSIARRKGTLTSEIMYTTSVHSRGLAFTRCDERSRVIHDSGVTEAAARRLGMKFNTSEAARNLPLVRLSEKLRAATQLTRKRADGSPVVSAEFDSTLSAAAVPDHLLNGLMKNVLTLCFLELPNDRDRKNAEIRILRATARNGLPTQTNLLRWEKRGKYAGLHSLTMSSMFCTFLFAAEVFLQINEIRPNKCFELPMKLQNVISLVYWWPTTNADGMKTVNSFTVDGGISYYAELTRTAMVYLNSAEKYVRECRPKGKVLDKPNAHRLLELCVHTIPNFGHARNCSEMVLEMVHRVFKEWLETNTHPDSHISGMERAISRDWFGRISDLHKTWRDGSPSDRECAETGLRRLILGEQKCQEKLNAEALQEFRLLLTDCFRDPVQTLLNGATPINNEVTHSRSWIGLGSGKGTKWENAAAKGKDILRSIHGDVVVREFDRAVLIHDVDGSNTRSYGHNVVRSGDIISVVCDGNASANNPQVIRGRSGVHDYMQYFAIRGVMQRTGSKELFTAGLRMKKEGTAYKVGGDVLLVEMNDHVRRAADFHVCDIGCDRNVRNSPHCAGDADDALFRILGRRAGFPPHMG